ncbi:ABC transporter permease [Virgibacillus sp. W0181]|uniref:ABC transporter permease n=1 Tax=Virgibacillus sp. W0181 TaxID=3391581 RepID=UPI003F46A5E6
MLAILKLELLKTMQDRGIYFWTFILPIIFTVLFISVLTSGVEKTIQEQMIVSIIPGYAVMFVFFIMITMVSTFIKDRDNGMTARLASTPLSPFQYLLGKWIPYMIIVLIQITVLLLFGKLVYDVPLREPLLLVILAIFLTFTVTGLGMALALIAKTDNMGIAVTQVIALGGAVIGGLWMPIDMMPEIIKTISKFLPQYWAHQAFTNTMTGTIQYSDFALAISILFAFGIIGFITAFVRYPHFLKLAKN